MKSQYIIKKQIGEYKAGLILIFNEYTEKNFKKDLEDLKAYHEKKIFPENRTKNLNSEEKEELKKQLDFKFYDTKYFDKITYESFKHLILELFSNMYFYTIEHNKELMTSSEFNLQLFVRRIPGGEYYFGYGDYVKVSDPENACFEVSGFWLIQQVILPYINKENAFSIIQRFLLHELTHHYDNINKLNIWSVEREGRDTYEKKINKFYKKLFFKKRSAFCLNCLYTSLFNLREEGLADFYARKNSSRFEINIQGIKAYNANILKLSTILKKGEAEEFYDKEISSGNLTPSNEHTMGRNMCVTIAMALAKKMNKIFTILINNDKITSDKLKEFNSIFSSNKTIYVEGLDSETLSATVEIVRPLAHYLFVHEYENACKELGIKEENMIITKRRFYGLVHDFIVRLEKYKEKTLESAGFEYSEEKIKEL